MVKVGLMIKFLVFEPLSTVYIVKDSNADLTVGNFNSKKDP